MCSKRSRSTSSWSTCVRIAPYTPLILAPIRNNECNSISILLLSSWHLYICLLPSPSLYIPPTFPSPLRLSFLSSPSYCSLLLPFSQLEIEGQGQVG